MTIEEARKAVRVAARELGAKSWVEGKKDKVAYAIVLKDVMEAADDYALAVLDEALRVGSSDHVDDLDAESTALRTRIQELGKEVTHDD